jgi:hypothetical protein
MVLVAASGTLTAAYIMWGGPEVDRPARATVWGTLWAIAGLMLGAFVWGWKHRYRDDGRLAKTNDAQLSSSPTQVASSEPATWTRVRTRPHRYGKIGHRKVWIAAVVGATLAMDVLLVAFAVVPAAFSRSDGTPAAAPGPHQIAVLADNVVSGSDRLHALGASLLE